MNKLSCLLGLTILILLTACNENKSESENKSGDEKTSQIPEVKIPDIDTSLLKTDIDYLNAMTEIMQAIRLNDSISEKNEGYEGPSKELQDLYQLVSGKAIEYAFYLEAEKSVEFSQKLSDIMEK